MGSEGLRGLAGESGNKGTKVRRRSQMFFQHVTDRVTDRLIDRLSSHQGDNGLPGPRGPPGTPGESGRNVRHMISLGISPKAVLFNIHWSLLSS